MTEDYAVRRKEYVADIRKSFDTMTNDMEDTTSGFSEGGSSILLFKIRLFLSICIFIAFIFCKYTGYDFYSYQAEDVIDILTDNQYYTNLQNYVMIQTQAPEEHLDDWNE